MIEHVSSIFMWSGIIGSSHHAIKKEDSCEGHKLIMGKEKDC